MGLWCFCYSVNTPKEEVEGNHHQNTSVFTATTPTEPSICVKFKYLNYRALSVPWKCGW